MNHEELTESDFEDPLEWVYEVRRRISAKYDYDIHKIFSAMAERQREEEDKGKVYVRLPIVRRKANCQNRTNKV